MLPPQRQPPPLQSSIRGIPTSKGFPSDLQTCPTAQEGVLGTKVGCLFFIKLLFSKNVIKDNSVKVYSLSF